MAQKPFWKTKSLTEMTRAEWESLCDGCGRCCLNKYEDEDTRTIAYTDVACKLFDPDTCRCSDYKNRTKKVQDCVVLTPDIMDDMYCLPPTCAYRRLAEGKDLSWWHHLVSGSRDTVHEAGISVRNRVVSEVGLKEREIARRLVAWPMSTRAKKT